MCIVWRFGVCCLEFGVLVFGVCSLVYRCCMCVWFSVLKFGVCVVWRFGVWSLVFGVWCLVFGVWSLVFGFQQLGGFGLQLNATEVTDDNRKSEYVRNTREENWMQWIDYPNR